MFYCIKDNSALRIQWKYLDFLPVRKAPQSRVEKQLAFLIKRQNQFKQAALEAKKRGEIEQAKEYLRMSKGFNQLIDASRGGLPIDMNTVSVCV